MKRSKVMRVDGDFAILVDQVIASREKRLKRRESTTDVTKLFAKKLKLGGFPFNLTIDDRF